MGQTLLDVQTVGRLRAARDWTISVRLLFRFIIVLLSITVILMGYVWSRLAYLQKQKELILTSREVRKLEQDIYELRIKLATLKHPERLDQLAMERWQLQIPTAEQIIILEDTGEE